jgi:Mrp family chromosome partitioning ATPase
VVDVAFGDTDLSRALRPVRLDDLGTSTLQVLPAGDEADDLEARTAASSRWEPTGSRPQSLRAEAHLHSTRRATPMKRTRPVAAMGTLAASESFRVLLDDLREQSDVVFVDAPPLLVTSDAITLGSIVDGIILVTGLDRLRWQTLDDVTRALSMCSAPTLGCVVTGTPAIAEFGAYADSNGRG